MSRVEPSTKLDLERIVFIGRTFNEYLDMFALSREGLRGKKILDCPAGACSFTAIGNQLGLDITACDIAYGYPVENLESKGFQDIVHAMDHMEIAKEKFIWNYFEDTEALKKHRLNALKSCIHDMLESNERYVPASLPSLPFKDKEFDILLSAHFLFMYADHLDYEFHLTTIKELLRVTKEEIRIFPLIDLEGNRYKYLEVLTHDLVTQGCSVEEVDVSYEFMKNGNSMLKIGLPRDR